MIVSRCITLVMIAVLWSCNSATASANPAPPAPRTLVKRIVVEEARRSSLPPSLALAVAKIESDFSPQALSAKGARGVMQIMPRTARDRYGVDADALWDPRHNVRFGIDYLSDLIRRYGGRWDLALSHYNGGTLVRENGVARPHSATRAYVARVLKWQRLYADQERVWNGLPALTAALPPESPPRAVEPPDDKFAAVEARARVAARRLDDFGATPPGGRWLEVGRIAATGVRSTAIAYGAEERNRLQNRLRVLRQRPDGPLP